MPDIISTLLVGAVGAIFGAWASGRYVIWQAREAARHDLRAIVIRMGVYVEQCKGINGNRVDPWTVYMEDAIAAYLRYRTLLLPWQRAELDRNWTKFQGTRPDGDTPYAHTPMGDNIQGTVARSIQFLKTIG
jgi:hypothetical protein